VVVANIVALGIIVELAKIVSMDAIESAILARVPKGTEKINKEAFQLGVELGKELLA
jgi:2-oxoglutarate ferredoxin oxidoreductase subunit gamma